jgi:hypothetical protein
MGRICHTPQRKTDNERSGIKGANITNFYNFALHIISYTYHKMTEIPSKYEPGKAESKWYGYWMKNGFFRSVPDEREPYTIVIPPPNVTGVLHMATCLTIQSRMFW